MRMNFELMIRRLTQMILGEWLRVQMKHFALLWGEKTTFLRPFSTKLAQLERRLVVNEITARISRHSCVPLVASEQSSSDGSCLTRLRLVVTMLLMLCLGVSEAWGADTLPFTVSTASSKYYYKINIVVNNSNTNYVLGYYINPSSPYVNTSNVSSDDLIWYIMDTNDANDVDAWGNKSYYFINAVSKQYLYYTGNSTNSVEMRSITDPTATPDRFKFKVRKTSNSTGYINTNYGGSFGISPLELYKANNSLTGASTDVKQLIFVIGNTTGGNNLSIKDANAWGQQWMFESTSYVSLCKTPTITYDNTTGNVTISSETEGATIYYTMSTSGSEPSAPTSSSYDGTGTTPIVISNVTTPIIYKTIATKTDFEDSEVATQAITQVETPTITLSNGKVLLSCATAGASIYYEIGNTADDVSTPTSSSTLYSGSIENADGKYIKAIAVKGGWINSAVATSSQISFPCSTPVIRKATATTFTITCSFPTSGVTIYYTKGANPADPTTSSTRYEGAVSFSASELPFTVKAIAVASNYDNSEIATLEIVEGLTLDDDDYYIIASDDDFKKFITMADGVDFDKKFKITDDINATGTSAVSQAFTGELKGVAKGDGTFPVISNLDHPLFSTIDGGVVKNVMLKGVTINKTGNVGAIAREVGGYSRIYNCGILPSNNKYRANSETSYLQSSDGYCGGLVGWLKGDSRVINCFSYANIKGGTDVAGIVGHNDYASNTTKTDNSNKYGNLKTMVMNCMFYGDITGGSTKRPVYGGLKIDNNADNGINNYNYYRANRYEYNKEKGEYENIDDVTFDDTYAITDYYCSWPAEAQYLTRYEYYRSILNANRPLAGWWVKSDVAPSTMAIAAVQAVEKDASLMAKWVLDPKIAPYPILKAHNKYSSIVNPDPDNVWNAEQNKWISRKTEAKPYEGKNLGSINVTVKGGDFTNSKSESLELQILDMDTLNHDYCYAKVQLPYYNELFGNPNGNTWAAKYANNYTTKVVTGWNITSATGTGATAGSFKGAASIKGTTNSANSTPDVTTGKPWEDGYNFADRNCTNKDLFQKSGRVFAQGGYYYVPVGVTDITIEAHWAAARYVCNADNSYDRVKVGGTHFEPAGTIPTSFQGQKVFTTIQSAIGAATSTTENANVQEFGKVTSKTVYDQAIVLLGSMQLNNGNTRYQERGDNAIPFTLMSVDLDFDNEPDNCLDLQFRSNLDRPGIQPIRFDFLPIPDLGLAVRVDKLGYSIGIMVPYGHFEITETAFMHTTQFEYDGPEGKDYKMLSPIILNGGHFEQFVARYGGRKTEYIIMGGHFRLWRFTPGSHTKGNQKNTRHCAVSVMGGEFPEFYLSGYYRTDANPDADNPHCYVNGGRFGTMAGACVEKVNGSVTFQIDHAIIDEFYGGGTNAIKSLNTVTGSIDVTINNSFVGEYYGGPQVGDMGQGKTITTHADGTTFRQFYGGGRGGTSFFREEKYDDETDMPTSTSHWTGWGDFKPLETYDTNTETNKGYHALYEFELFNSSNGLNEKAVKRCYYRWARFAKTQTGAITNVLTNCTLLGDFYAAGNLAAVGGTTETGVDLGNCDVESTLTNTTVNGSVYGAGFSAAIPSLLVHDKNGFHIPERSEAGVIKDGWIDYEEDGDVTNDGSIYKYYRWTHSNDDLPEGVTLPTDISTSKATFKGSDNKYYCYTPQTLTGLGAVTGNVFLTINGNTKVGYMNGNTLIGGNVFGGGDSSAVTGNTTVTLAGNANVLGNVFGGGNEGHVEGSTTVNIQETAPTTN